ncbi:MAG: PKD domain-containing protein [Bacteroidetes bacterium]|nr:PKD domain-containing protein [Bacteroidota bacterium]
MNLARYILFILLLCCISLAHGQNWFERTYGDTLSEWSYDVQETSDSGFIITGYTSSFGAGGFDAYLIKTDKKGDTLWTKTYGGTSQDFGYAVRQTKDGGYIFAGMSNSVGLGNNDIWLVKTDANGDTMWTSVFGGTSFDRGYAVQQTKDGGYIVVGTTMSFGAGMADVYIIKTDSFGDSTWSRVYGGSNADHAYAVIQTLDNGYLVVGSTKSFGSFQENVYMLKLKPNGDLLWTKAYGGVGIDIAYDVLQTTDSGFVIAGGTRSFAAGAGTEDFYLLKTKVNGDSLWHGVFSGTMDETAKGLVVNPDGSFLMVGYTNSYGAGDYDLYLVKADTGGNLLWGRTYGGTAFDQGAAMDMTYDNGIIMSGWTKSIGAGANDFYLVRTNDFGCLVAPTITHSNDTTVCAGNPVQLNATGGVSYNWSPSLGLTNDTIPNPIATPPYTVKYNIIVSDSLSCGAQGYVTVSVIPFPVSNFGYVDSFMNVSFTDSSIVVNTWHWDFGDGDTSILQNPNHTYLSMGVYNVCLIVTSPCGVDTFCDSVSAQCLAPIANFYWINEAYLDVDFSDTSIQATSWHWDFGDGDTSNLEKPSHTYLVNGTYYVCLIVTNPCGSDTFCDWLTVFCNFPEAGFTINDSSLTVAFTDTSNYVDSWFWDFGDGKTSTLQNPIHVYTVNGKYDICLIATNPCGSDTFCDSASIVCTFPKSNFSSSDLFLQVTFVDASTSTVQWFWDFGDGNSANLQSPVHTYFNSGTYNVCLDATNNCGTDQFCDNITIVINNIDEVMRENKLISISPNPFSEQTHILLLDPNITIGASLQIEVYNIYGKKVREEIISGKGLLFESDILQDGIYFYRILNDSQYIGSGKMIIQR